MIRDVETNNHWNMIRYEYYCIVLIINCTSRYLDRYAGMPL